MQLSVPAGSRLTIVTGARRVPVRTLADLEVDLDADRVAEVDVAVMAPTELVDLAEGHVEVGTPTGLVTVSVQVLQRAPGLVLRLGRELHRSQRREAVRGDVALDVLIALPDGSGSSCRVVRGRTLNVSAGGLLVSLPTEPDGIDEAGPLLDAEITLPGDLHVSAVLEVVDVDQRGVRTAFASIEPAAQEMLVGLVFARERADLARRRLLREVLATDAVDSEVSATAGPTAGCEPGGCEPGGDVLAQVLPMAGHSPA